MFLVLSAPLLTLRHEGVLGKRRISSWPPVSRALNDAISQELMQPHTHSTRTRPVTLTCSQMSATRGGGAARVSSSLTSSTRTRAHSASPSMPGELILALTICSSHLAGVGAASSPCPAPLLFALCSFLGWGSIIRMYLCSQLHTHTRAHRLPLCGHWKPILLQWSEAFTSGCVNTESNKPVRAAKWACWSGRRRLLKHGALDMENKACHQLRDHAHVNFPSSLWRYATF